LCRNNFIINIKYTKIVKLRTSSNWYYSAVLLTRQLRQKSLIWSWT